jgi:F-type H+-transporting ATPase subunit epsilon
MAKTTEIRFVVITPERQVLQQAVSSVVFTAHDGEMGVLTGRAPLMCELGIGQLRYETAGQTRRLFIDGGFAQVYENSVTVLTQRAMPAEEIAAETIAAAERAVDELRGTDAATCAAREQAQQRVRVLRRLQQAQ